MKYTELSWKSYDGVDIYAQTWTPQGKVKSVIYIVHGLGEHSGRYNKWAEHFLASGYSIVACDLRGHGKSGGQRGHAPSYDHYCDEIEVMMDKTKIMFQDIPHFLYGHSMGGLLSLYYIIQRQPEIKGAIITSPALMPSALTNKLARAVIHLLSFFMPRLSFPNGIKPDTLSRDIIIGKTYLNDPLVHDKVSTRNLKEMLRTAKFTINTASDINIPLLIMHGSADRIIFIQGTENLVNQLKNEHSFKQWEGAFHELHNELEKEQVYLYIANWINTVLDNESCTS